MYVEIVLGCFAVLIGALIIALNRPPPKLKAYSRWVDASEPKGGAKVRYKKVHLSEIPRKAYRFCLIGETDETRDVAACLRQRRVLDQAAHESGHTILIAQVEYPNKVQWVYYSARPIAAIRLLREIDLPVSCRYGQAEDGNWDEYRHYAKLPK